MNMPKCEYCKTKLEFKGQWEFNLEIQPNKYSWHCPECGTNFVCDAEETARYIKDIPVQIKLQFNH